MDHSVAQFEAQRLEIVCLKREVVDQLNIQYRLRAELEERTLQHRTQLDNAVRLEREVEQYKALWHAAMSSANEYAGRLAIAEEQRDDCRRLLRELMSAVEVVGSVMFGESERYTWRNAKAEWWVQLVAAYDAAKAAGGDE